MCSTCGCKGAEGVGERMKKVNIKSLPLTITEEQWSIIMKMRDELNMTTNEVMAYIIKEGIKKRRVNYEGFEAPMTRYDEYCISCGSDSGANSNLCMKCQKMFGVKKASNRMIARLGLGAESFEAESLEDLTKDQLIDLIRGLEDREVYVKDFIDKIDKSAESFEAEEWDFGNDREALRNSDENSDFNNAWRRIFRQKRREWPSWGQKFYDKYKWTLNDSTWNPYVKGGDLEDEEEPKGFRDAESFEAEGERTFTVSKGPKRMYIVVEYNDGKELFLDGDGQKQFMEELAEAEATRDEILIEKLFGVGSDYHGIAQEVVEAEGFEAQRKLTDIDRDGKPYTGQIYPDHPDLDPVKADRNKDGYMSSWERALGNQVARGMEKYKSERKPSMKRMSIRKTSRKSTSILPSVIVVGVIAAIVGSKIRK